MVFAYVPPPVSPRAQELAQRLAQVIEEFQQRHPDLASLEVRQAVQIAASRTCGSHRGVVVASAVIVGVTTALGLGIFASLQHGARGQMLLPMVLVMVAVITIALLLALRSR